MGRDGDWHDQLAATMRELRRVVLAQRDGARILAGRFTTGPTRACVECGHVQSRIMAIVTMAL